MHQFIADHDGPLMYSMQGDCTPSTTRFMTSAQTSIGKIWRAGRKGVELLMRKAMLYSIGLDGPECVPYFTDPVEAHDTTMWTYFVCLTTLFQCMRQLRPVGLLLIHVALDGAGFSAVTRLLEQYYSAYINHAYPEGPQRMMARLTLLFCSTRCCLHDAMGGIRWSMKHLMEEDQDKRKGFLRVVHVAIASLRNGFDILVTRQEEILDLIEWEESGDLDEDIAELWTELGCKDQRMVDDLVFLNPRVRDQKIICEPRAKTWPNYKEKILGLYTYLWSFKGFVDSRFGGMGPSLRVLIRSMLAGTGVYVKHLLRTGAKTYWLGGFLKMRPEHLNFCIVQCLSTKPADALIFEMMADDRLAQRPQFYVQTMRKALALLMALDDYMFVRLAALNDDFVSEVNLRSLIMYTAMVACAYIHRHIFHELLQLPWTLCSGDIDQNLKDLRDGPEPVHPVARSLRELMLMRYSIKALHDVVVLLSLVRWSTLAVEQMHGSLAVVHKYHAQFLAETLKLRAFLHMFAQLVRPKKQDAALWRIQRRVTCLEGKHPLHMSGVNVMVMHRQADAVEVLGGSGREDMSSQRARLGESSILYGKLSAKAKLPYAAEARRIGAERQKAIDAELEELSKKRTAQESKLEKDRATRGLMGTVNDTKFNEAQLQRLDERYNSVTDFQPDAVNALRNKATAPIQATEIEARIVLHDQPYFKRPWWYSPTQWWMSALAVRRQHFTKCCIQFASHTAREWWHFMYAMQNPLEVSLLRLQETTYPIIAPGGFDTCKLAVSCFYQRTFVADDVLDFKHDWDIAQMDNSVVLVLPNVIQLNDGVFACNSQPMLFHEFVDNVPQPPVGSRTAVRSDIDSKEIATYKDVEAHPWLLDHHKQKDKRAKRVASKGAKTAWDDLLETIDVVEDRTTHDVSLADLRDEWKLKMKDAEAALVHCRVEHRGGDWTKTNLGKESDRCRGIPITAAAKDVLGLWGKNGEFGNGYIRYTKPNAELLSYGWCHKVSYFVRIWLDTADEDDDDFAFTPEHNAAYVEPEELVEAAASWPPGGVCAQRLGDLRAIYFGKQVKAA